MEKHFTFRVSGEIVTLFANNVEEAKKILQLCFGDVPMEFLRMDLIV